MSALEPIAAKVFQGSRRRYFSRAAAEVSFFWAAVHRRCECENPSMENGWEGESCVYHREGAPIEKLKARFLRIHFGRGRKP